MSTSQPLVQSDVREDGTEYHQGPVKSWWEILCTWVGLGCCMPEDKWEKRPLAELVQNHDRHCTDVPCCLFLVAVIVAEVIMVIYAAGAGADPAYLMHGVDYNGTLCDDNKNGRFATWPALKTSYKIKICIDDCNDTKNSDIMVDTFKSSSFLGAWCLPSSKFLEKNATGYHFDKASQAFDRGIADLNTAKWLILISAFMAVFIAFAYIYFVSYLARCLIFVSTVACFVCGAILGTWLIRAGQSDMKDDETEDMGKAELALGIIVWILLVCFFLALLWMRKRIQLAFFMLKEASRAVRDVKGTIMFPIAYSFVGMAWFCIWIVIALYMYSCKDKKDKDMPDDLVQYYGDTYVDVEFDDDLQRALVLHFCILLYVVQVIIYFGFMVLAGTFADWYFSIWEPNSNKKVRGYDVAELSHRPVWESFFRVLRFHMGSLAFGALLITIVRLIRWWLLYIEKKTANSDNCLLKCLLGCAQCCLKCCDCILNKINKEGFIFTTIYGTAFCYSSLNAIKLIWNNVARAAIVEGITHYMEIFGRITIAACTTGLCMLIMVENPTYKNQLSSVIIPGLVIFILSYLIGSLFMLVYEVAVDTIFICFLVDEAVHPQGPKFAHQDLVQRTSLHKSSV